MLDDGRKPALELPRPLADGDVLDEGVERVPCDPGVRPCHDLDGEPVPIPVKRPRLTPDWRTVRGGHEELPELLGVRPGARAEQTLRRHADGLACRPSEGDLRLMVPVPDDSLGVHSEERLARRLDHPPGPLLAHPERVEELDTVEGQPEHAGHPVEQRGLLPRERRGARAGKHDVPVPFEGAAPERDGDHPAVAHAGNVEQGPFAADGREQVCGRHLPGRRPCHGPDPVAEHERSDLGAERFRRALDRRAGGGGLLCEPRDERAELGELPDRPVSRNRLHANACRLEPVVVNLAIRAARLHPERPSDEPLKWYSRLEEDDRRPERAPRAAPSLPPLYVRRLGLGRSEHTGQRTRSFVHGGSAGGGRGRT